MSVVSKAASLWRNLFQRERRQQSLDDELRSYVDLVADEFEREGMTREVARRRAMAGTSVERSKELTRDAWTGALQLRAPQLCPCREESGRGSTMKRVGTETPRRFRG
jgi:hypothetical protein